MNNTSTAEPLFKDLSAQMSYANTQEDKISDNLIAATDRFVQLALNGLVPMFDPQRQVFCYRLKKTKRGLVREGISRRYTLISLMGLDRIERGGIRSPIKCNSVLESLLADLDWVDNIGDLGLLLWLCALMAPERLRELQTRLDIVDPLTRYKDARQGRTMELAWFLSGLCHWGLSCPEKLPELRNLAFETFRRIRNNQSKHGIFGHLARNKSLSGAIRGRLGSFADQVYPIYAMSKFFEAYGERGAAAHALDCARVLCEAQGPLGQWWWQYDSSTGKVFAGYPVFSVHQHGMAPMTLFALGKATHTDFGPWISRGLEWINRNNELSVDMEDGSARVIWRCICRPLVSKYLAAAFPRAASRNLSYTKSLRTVFECRPYELGWLLYAFAPAPASDADSK